jgi:hypothetical protein
MGHLEHFAQGGGAFPVAEVQWVGPFGHERNFLHSLNLRNLQARSDQNRRNSGDLTPGQLKPDCNPSRT